jgi:uncharacterized protein (DUF2267 family)
MPTLNSFDRAVHVANRWVASVARAFSTDDRLFAYRVLRAWLHGLRDRLPPDSAAHVAAQLPELLRGVYYEGWDPDKVPVKYDAQEYVRRFARAAGIRAEQVPQAAATVTSALQGCFSTGGLSAALQRLPQSLRHLLTPAGDGEGASAGAVAGQEGRAVRTPAAPMADERLARLERGLSALTEAVLELVHGLEPSPVEGPAADRTKQAARRAHQILLSSGQ